MFSRATWAIFCLLGLALGLTFLMVIAPDLDAAEQRRSDIRNTKHNLSHSSTGPDTPDRNIQASSEANGGTEEICVFCHTPHGASTNPGQPLWNRNDSDPAGGYEMYSSASLQATASMAVSPTQQSKLCLSCHDGTLAIGAVGNAPGSGSGSGITMTASDGTTSISDLGDIPGTDNRSGFTRNLGVDLSNDHPISFPYSDALADADGELVRPGDVTHIADRNTTTRPIYPLTGDNLQCTTCHDPHVRGIDAPTGTTAPGTANSKFLRGPRFQMSLPSGVSFEDGVFDETTGNATRGDIICLACHDKELGGNGAIGVWKSSVHANPSVADEEYTSTASTTRQFPAGIQVYQASCLNCHDTHSVSGSRRLLREGTDDTGTPKSGGNAALEETCYQCHTDGGAGTSILDLTTGEGIVPNIEAEFNRTYHMPITTADQRSNTDERHDITDADFSETSTLLGKGDDQNRHAECTDCHNPHRMQRNNRFNSDGLTNEVVDNFEDSTTKRTHVAGLNATSTSHNDGREGNVASGVLRGTWGVDIDYPTTIADSFQSSLSSFPLSVNIGNNNLFPERMDGGDFIIRRGDPGSKTLARSDEDEHLTREYQLCFKCHSSFSQGDRTTGVGPSRADTDLALEVSGGSTESVTTPTSSNTPMTHYTNVAAEFLSVQATNPPTSGTDQGENGNSGSACANGADGDTNDPCATAGTGADTTPIAGPGNNHRSWHPVVYPTGRDEGERTNSGDFDNRSFQNIRAPFDDNVGTQTMYCSDCHGADGSWTVNTGPDDTQVQGPHGSSERFILKGNWDGTVTPTNVGGSICGNCHAPATSNSGFAGESEASHNFDEKRGTYCMGCHVAVPHGWKNKAFLANLNCVGPEVEGTQDEDHTAECTQYGGTDQQTHAPYYNRAILRILNFAESGAWREGDCGGSGETGRDWMEATCEGNLNY